jgi:methionine-rich copper-binding protein CopC
MFNRIALAGSATTLALLLSVSIASAHARYGSSTPAADSSIPTLPATLSVTFTEELRAVTLTVTGPDGKTVSTGNASIDLSNREVATVPLGGGGPGNYTVKWTSVSDDDGESADGSFGFTVATSAPAAAAPAVTSGPAAATTAAAPAVAACPATDRPDAGFDERVNTYCKRQLVRDQYHGKIDEATFNGAIAGGARLEDALHEAMEEMTEHHH